MLLIAVPSYAQCIGTIKKVEQDTTYGSIIVETEYKLNGVVVQIGKARYIETNGTNSEIIAKAKADIKLHCENTLKRIPNNTAYIIEQSVIQQKALTTPIIIDIEDDLIGFKSTVEEAITKYKGKDIKVTYDEKNTTSISVITP